MFGKVLVNSCNFWNGNDKSVGKVCILTAFRKRINDEIYAMLNGVKLSIGVFELEDDWTPFKPFQPETLLDSDEDDDNDDGVSDTYVHEDFEEGEIGGPEPVNHGESPAKDPAPAVGEVRDDTDKTKGFFVEGEKSTSILEACDEINDGRTPIAANINDTPASVSLGRATHNGPIPCGSAGCPSTVGLNSSPDFEIGDSTVKRRRTKKKNRGTSCVETAPTFIDKAPVPPLFDLNKNASASQNSDLPDRSRNSPSHSSSASSSEVGQTIVIGKQVGFQVEIGNGAVLEALNGGGGAKIGKP
ncbi:hypothetical protein L2E82_46654 [Cichorium intybus]|uniref:Uncharacterized protein n=1 Tax=Cichorium intybus TaxID=13427 RepID=A0ACB8YU37_CICIN|nr:hypothetical protein L2E82_46654 [Cichorium intybus]